MKRLFPFAVSITLVASFFSCIGTAPVKEVNYIDSLNLSAYGYRYKNLDSAYLSAKAAFEGASPYRQGKAEACNNLGFCAFMQMDFDCAEKMFQAVYDLTKNELELLIADIGMMKICQRTAMNKEFYDYRNNALRRIRRIDEDKSLFIDYHEKIRLNYAYTEFSIVSAIYYYYLQQLPEAVQSINEINPALEFKNDTGQLLYYHYIRGATSLTGGDTWERAKMDEFDELFLVWRLASEGGYVYFEGNSLQGLANLMATSGHFEFFRQRSPRSLEQFGIPVDSLLPLELGRMALEKFREYNDIYQIAGAYVSIARYLNQHGHYSQALDSLTRALDYVNLHHRLYYGGGSGAKEVLYPYVERDTIYTEVSWLTGKKGDGDGTPDVKTVPEWISRIREQLSVSYAGLGMKKESDYNRNVYLEILNFTRQDKELESRYSVLQQESRTLNALLLSILGSGILLIVLFWIFTRHARKRSRQYISRLRLTLDICQKVTASIPSDIDSPEDIISAIEKAILPDLGELVGARHIAIRISGGENGDPGGETGQPPGPKTELQLYVPDKEHPVGVLVLYPARPLTKDDLTLLRVICPYIAWTLDNGMTFISLGNEQEKLEKQRYIYEQHIARNKRENIVKKACLAIVNGIVPYIDRIINEVYKLKEKGLLTDEKMKQEKYLYIDELVTTINDYNDILALWIKLKQGSISLNIENFPLNDLFELVAKGRRTFDMKRQTFEVEPTRAVVKADRALTLFMINTLVENARKYTPEGGRIRVYARATDEYVETSVVDDGIGLSPADVAKIKDENIYDSRTIGITGTDDSEELRRLKGSGFGLMNCKGIIEKYKKTNKLFDACLFSVESKPGEGSRFFFRLPLGIRKNMGVLLCLLLPLGMGSCHHGKPGAPATPPDSLSIQSPEYDRLLEEAFWFADTARYCNVITEFDLAIQYIDSAMDRLNTHYCTYAPDPKAFLSLDGEDAPAELTWWNEMFETDYEVILSIRNEAAIACLALKKWDLYDYNNKAFTSFYKLGAEDKSLEAYCRVLERSTTNKMVGVILFVFLVVSSSLGYYVFYARKRTNNRWNLEQVLDINNKVFSASLVRPEESVEMLQREENTLREIPRKIVNEAFDLVNELMEINHLGLAVYNERQGQLEFACYPPQNEMPAVVTESFDTQTFLMRDNTQAFPLIIEVGDNHRCVGVLYLEGQEEAQRETGHLLFELISRYMAVAAFNTVVKPAMRYRDIESAYEDAYRASTEDNILHVQNMVLDNCLSTIKHETVYYPNKIKQIIAKLAGGKHTGEGEKEDVDAISELIEYYKGIFAILSANASRQLEDVTFRRAAIPVKELLAYAEKYFKKAGRKEHPDVGLTVDYPADEENIIGDVNQLRFLLENLIDEALAADTSGRLNLRTCHEGKFIKFLFTDTRRNKAVKELNELFYPDLNRMASGEKGKLAGTEYLICKQIIRDHDEFTGRRGCRINAEPSEGGGFTVYFTIPCK